MLNFYIVSDISFWKQQKVTALLLFLRCSAARFFPRLFRCQFCEALMLSPSLSSHFAAATLRPPLKIRVRGQSGTHRPLRSKRKIQFPSVNPPWQQGKKFTSKGASTVTERPEMAMDPTLPISVFIPQNSPIRACERNLMARCSGKSHTEKSQCPPMSHDSHRPTVGT